MSALRRDLVERKLWVIVALLVVAVAAVPVFLLKSASADTTPTVPVPPSATPAGTQTATTQKVDKKESSKVVLARIARNPFASAVPKLSSKPSSSTSSSAAPSSTTSTTATTSSPSSAVAMVSPTPASAGAGATGASTGSSSGSSTGGIGSSATGTSSGPTSTIASVSPTPQGSQPTQAQSWTIYSVSIQFSKDGFGPVHKDIPRLTALPSAGNPQLMFFGVMSGGREAVFGLGAGVAHAGPGLCRPSRSSCSAIVLKPGEGEEVAWPTATGGVAQAILHLDKITSRVTHSRKEALAAYQRVSKAGICDLSLAQPVSYDPDTGTVQNFPKDACKAQASSAPFAFLKTTP